MPELIEYSMTDANALDNVMAAEAVERRTTIERAWAYYEGKHTRPLKVRKGQPDDNVVINLVQKVVNQTVSLLMGTVPTISVANASGTEINAVQESLDAIWEANMAAIFLHDLAVIGALAGHCDVKLVPDPVKGVRFVLQDPAMVSTFWRPEDMSVVVCYRILWRQGQREQAQDIVSQEKIWLIRDLQREKGSPWQIVNEEVWAYPFPPLMDWKNLPTPRTYYGVSDLTDIALNDSLNFVASNTNRILKLHAHPKTMGIGVIEGGIKETAVDGFWAIPNPEAKISNLEMQSDLGSSMAFLQLLEASFYSEHRTVDLSMIKDRLGQLTNFGLRLLFHEALDKLITKRALYGEGLVELSRRALILTGGPDVRPTIRWPDPLPENAMEEMQIVQQEMDAKLLSKQSATDELGLDWETEQGRLQKENQQEGNVGAELLRGFLTGNMGPPPSGGVSG
jgi:hypothetical protein